MGKSYAVMRGAAHGITSPASPRAAAGSEAPGSSTPSTGTCRSVDSARIFVRNL